uniref:Uncharacterized protein n=1 Tax=Anguilla anguilla TaxID=7936 RepID=A0A0E9TF84_ANGAN
MPHSQHQTVCLLKRTQSRQLMNYVPAYQCDRRAANAMHVSVMKSNYSCKPVWLHNSS